MESSRFGPEISAGPGLDPGRSVPAQVFQPVTHRVNPMIAGNGTNGAADHHGGDVDAAQLQPFGSANLVRILPRAGKGAGRAVPWKRLPHDNCLSEVVECQNTGKGDIGCQGNDDIGLVAFGCTCHVLTQAVEPGRFCDPCVWIAACVHAATEFRQLLFQDRHRNAGRCLDPGQNLARRQRVKPRKREAAKKLAEGGNVGRVGQCLGGGDKSRDVVVADGEGSCPGRFTGRRDVPTGAIILGAGSAHQVVVEIIAVERQDDFVRNVGPVQPV